MNIKNYTIDLDCEIRWMKKISLEIQAACGVKTGIGWYIYNLVKNLKESNHNEYTGEIFNFMSRKDLEDFSKINLNIKQNKIIGRL